MFRDPIDDRLFLLGSHLTGWAANGAMLSVSDRTTVCGSRWTYLGNPATGPGAAATFNAQSTFVLPYRDPATNRTTVVMMADMWGFPDETKATMVRLPACRPALHLRRAPPSSARPLGMPTCPPLRTHACSHVCVHCCYMLCCYMLTPCTMHHAPCLMHIHPPFPGLAPV